MHPSEGPRWLRRGAPWAIMAALFLLFAVTDDNSLEHTATDWAMYVMHARNLLAGLPYAQTTYVVHPETVIHGGFSYPSGYPLALAPVYAAADLNIPLLKIYTDAILVLSLWPAYLFLRRYLNTGTSLLLLVLLGTGHNFLQMQGQLGSEGLYLLLSYTAIMTVLRFEENGAFEARPWRSGLLVGLLFAAAYLTRPVGAALSLALGLRTVWSQRRIPRYLWACALMVLAVALLNRAFLHNEAAYKEQFIPRLAHYISNAVSYAGYFSHLFATPYSHLWRYLLWGPAMLLAGAGCVRRWREGAGLADWYAVVMMAILLIYHMAGSRYLLPLYPVFVVYLVQGFDWVRRQAGARLSRRAQLAAAAVLLTVPAMNLWGFHYPPRVSLVGTPEFEQMAAWVKSQGKAYTVFWNPRVLTIRTGWPTGPYPLQTPQEIAGFFDRARPDYVIFEESYETDRDILAPVLEKYRGQLTAVWSNREFQVFRWRPSFPGP